MTRRDRIVAIVKSAAKSDLPADSESLFDAGVVDSFALVDVIGGLEQEFGLKIPDADVTPRKFESIERIEAYLAQHGV
jgi:acyl carrier protein